MASKTVERTTSKIAIITGGSRGLGRNTAIHLARRGVDVIFTYHSNQTEAGSLTREIEAMGQRAAAFRLDAADVHSFDGFVAGVRKTLQSWTRERFDYLVNNAGNALHAGFGETTEAQFDEIVNVHFKGVYFLTQKILPLMNDGGRIVNISSGLARFALPGSSAYGAAKGAIEVLTRYLAKELGPRRITANVVAPGAIQTDFSGGMVRDNPDLRPFRRVGAANGVLRGVTGVVPNARLKEARPVSGRGRLIHNLRHG